MELKNLSLPKIQYMTVLLIYSNDSNIPCISFSKSHAESDITICFAIHLEF